MTVDSKLILELKINANGEVTRKASKLGRKDTLEGKLLSQIYPGIRVARVSVPSELTSYEQSLVENSMAQLYFGGVTYKLVGASGSAKDGKFYFVDQEHSKPIVERFQHWPEAAMTYFSILVSDCKLLLEVPDLRVVVVPDHVLGTNDCRGWFRESLYRRLRLKFNLFCQFRLAFLAQQTNQAKGAVKAMSDCVADKLGVDVILPESSFKPGLKGGTKFLPQIGTSGRLLTGPAVLGIKQWSKVSEFGSSYTLVEHASEESLQTEIMPYAIEEIRQVRKAWEEGDYDALLELLGKSEPPEFDAGFDTESLENGLPSAADAWDPAEAVLIADKSGNSVKFPYVMNQLNRKLARWAYRTLTGGGFRLPSFALVDDGVLFMHEGKVLSASDWIPQTCAITSLKSPEGLCIRYPIRMQEDFLHSVHLSDDKIVSELEKALGSPGLPKTVIAEILYYQLRMEGAYILNSEKAKENGGDFDFDTICIMPSDMFPKFFAGRIAYGNQFHFEKNKLEKAKSPWWNVCLVAMKARGNKIGSITDLKTSCLAAGRPDLAYKLVEQLQNALDSLKHKVQVNEQVISDIRKEVDSAPWLKFKRERRVSDLPAFLKVADTDKVGRLYNHARKELGFLVNKETKELQDQMSIQDFRGLFTGSTVTKAMFEECSLVNSIYGDVSSQIIQREEQLKLELKNAQALWEAVRKSEDKDLRKSAVIARNKAQAAVWEHEQEMKDQFSSLHMFIHYWAQGKELDRQAWVQALNTIVTNGRGSGAVLFHAFPQEIVDAFAQQTEGESLPVRLPKVVKGHVRLDSEQRAFLVQKIENPDGQDGERSIFLFQYKGDRKLIFDNTSVPGIMARS
jgi:hypothetical protein